MRLDTYGNLYFEPGEKLPVLSMYQPSPDNPLKYIPKFDFNCKSRAFTGGIKKCSGKAIFQWTCMKFSKTIGIKDCRSCDAPDKPGSNTTPITFIYPEGFTH